MREKTAFCPLCDEEFGSKDDETTCPGCGIGLRTLVPIIRLSRSWFWELTPEAVKQLHKLWVEREEQ